jgi:hypothetical protein
MLDLMDNPAFNEDFSPTTLKFARLPNKAERKMNFELSARIK